MYFHEFIDCGLLSPIKVNRIVTELVVGVFNFRNLIRRMIKKSLALSLFHRFVEPHWIAAAESRERYVADRVRPTLPAAPPRSFVCSLHDFHAPKMSSSPATVSVNKTSTISPGTTTTVQHVVTTLVSTLSSSFHHASTTGSMETTPAPVPLSFHEIFLQTKGAKAVAGIFAWAAFFITCHQVI